jgi:hypothetical protein
MAKKKTTSKKVESTKKQTEYAVMYLHNVMKMSIKNISKELQIDEKDVENLINDPATTNKAKRKSKSHDLMIRKTSAKGANNVSIMTEAASQYNDEAKKNQTSNLNPRWKDCIRIIER